ncbi:acyl-CoA dehydrogenase family protein [Mycolicibacterium thermoresistibile]|uniref:Long-chain-acyl-CoA dehydrogenase n=2 Tax=Mycolicibacterium thermoresistibile TaxID=1797 RepID=G7CKG9_MYCT3|nr:acyl-CoA dehydrogenase family protein [Mycolicibacterium thermoresistibile]EHI11679.1 long-chain-acyl-CoA dehydrogenase [Mycolicibacterium thermoresistibile ATCC 19527]MCV7187894.1 acyl-CoA dehydrogenase family protein [Mycolicibacterium thermoresistibile]GAT16033.1 long-chain-acyl-CoA dehydrogenase [Mycolicibacterium thermoresistibile]SNW17002.1 acyl-CoA dehydrogenase FadE [Mycolicibacterium thermoresistibile]
MQRTLYDSDHEDFRAVVRNFVQTHIEPNDEKFAAEGRLSRELWRAAGDTGMLGLCVPEQYGGAGVNDYRFNAVMDEELTRAGMAYACGLGVHTHVVSQYLVHMTTEEQRARWLPDFVSGELITAVAMSEPSGGSDLAALRTRARRDGDQWVINGSKIFITNGATADLIVVAVRTGEETGSRGISLIAVEGDAPGLDRGRTLRKIGQHQGDTAELFFDDCRVPVANLIGEEGAGFRAMMEHLAQERLASAVCNVAHARHVLELTCRYVTERYAFGASLGALQHIRFQMADMVTELDIIQTYVDACVAAHVRGDLTAIDAAKAKLKSSDIQSQIVDTCVQLHGGYGYMEEYEVARAWRDARVTRIWAGTNEIMREVIGRSLNLREPSKH